MFQNIFVDITVVQTVSNKALVHITPWSDFKDFILHFS